ncbi:hypothetical protein [Actinoplanes sp. NPDC051851]|uniref:hypothetical protein n=1 Tax=Actinoplanes sp. NPDC051851 TaxID=3154753 RepID=UPI0034228F4B
MGRRTRGGKVAAARQSRTYWWGVIFGMAFFLFVAFPAATLVYLSLERFGTTSGPSVIATGTAIVTSCEHHALGTPYTCTATATWQPGNSSGEPPADVTVKSMRALSGEVAVKELKCGRSKYVYAHTCSIYTTDFPRLPGIAYLPMVGSILVFALTAVFAGRRLAARIFGKSTESAA